MASTRFNVQLSTHAYSFQITVPSSVTVLELKNRIAETCPGRPDRTGQRIIWQGRVIDDTSVVADVWTGADEHIIHLAVNPSAWRSSPPNSVPASQPKAASPVPMPVPGPSESAPSPAIVAPTPTSFTAIRPQVQAGQSPLPPSNWIFNNSPATPQPPTTFMPAAPPYSMAFIHHSHANALRVLCRLPLVPWWGGAVNDLNTAKGTSRQAVETSGATWPTILEQDYPAFSVSEPDGVQYAIGFNDGLPYLFLQTPDVPPSSAQRHAMRVLEATMPLLDQTPLVHAQATLQIQSALQASLLARTAFTQPIVARQPVRAVAAFGVPAALQPLAQVQIRAIIPPLVMLVFRAGLLLYIFTPSRRPLFATMIGLWVAWEVYTVVRAAMPADVRAPRRAAAAAAANGAGAGAAPGAAAANGANGVAGAPTRLAFLPEEPGVDALARLATIQLGNEAAMLEPGAEPAQVPDWRQRTRAFFTLFVLSVHPAWWERRRRLLRNREGQLRTRYRQPEPPAPEAAAEEQAPGQPPREPPPPPPQPPAGWAASYIDRVRNVEWIDE